MSIVTAHTNTKAEEKMVDKWTFSCILAHPNAGVGALGLPQHQKFLPQRRWGPLGLPNTTGCKCELK